MWQTKCLQKLVQELELETSQLKANLPATERLDWVISISLEAGVARVTIIPVAEPSLRGGGGEYEFDCDAGKLTLTEPYR